jgi:hypothetical protein
MGFTAKGDGVKLYFAVIKMDETPKLVEVFGSVEGTQTVGGNASSLPNRETLVRTNKQEILDFITLNSAVLDNGVEEPV